ncbi:MAG: hypothetical protein U0X71_05955 [Sphingobacteriaceae bacterium]
MKTKVLLGASIIALLVSASCKKSEDAKPITGKKKVTLKIVSSDQINEGATMRINVNSDAEANKGGAFSYAVTALGNGEVTIDATGILTAVKEGKVVLSVTSAGDDTYESASVSQTITVGPKVANLVNKDIGLSQDEQDDLAILTQGHKHTIKVEGVEDRKLKFEITSGGAFATVDETSGEITANNAGQATVKITALASATYHESSIEFTFEIVAPAVASSDIQFMNDFVKLGYVLGKTSPYGIHNAPKIDLKSITPPAAKYVVAVYSATEVFFVGNGEAKTSGTAGPMNISEIAGAPKNLPKKGAYTVAVFVANSGKEGDLATELKSKSAIDLAAAATTGTNYSAVIKFTGTKK